VNKWRISNLCKHLSVRMWQSGGKWRIGVFLVKLVGKKGTRRGISGKSKCVNRFECRELASL
jgi:hypothetical protein